MEPSFQALPCRRHLHDVPRNARELAADAIWRLLEAATLAAEGVPGGLPTPADFRPDLRHARALRAPASPLRRAPAGAPAQRLFGDFFSAAEGMPGLQTVSKSLQTR